MRWLPLDTWMAWAGRIGSRDCGDVWPDDYCQPALDIVRLDRVALTAGWDEEARWTPQVSEQYHREYFARRFMRDEISAEEAARLRAEAAGRARIMLDAIEQDKALKRQRRKDRALDLRHLEQLKEPEQNSRIEKLKKARPAREVSPPPAPSLPPPVRADFNVPYELQDLMIRARDEIFRILDAQSHLALAVNSQPQPPTPST